MESDCGRTSWDPSSGVGVMESTACSAEWLGLLRGPLPDATRRAVLIVNGVTSESDGALTAPREIRRLRLLRLYLGTSFDLSPKVSRRRILASPVEMPPESHQRATCGSRQYPSLSKSLPIGTSPPANSRELRVQRELRGAAASFRSLRDTGDTAGVFPVWVSSIRSFLPFGVGGFSARGGWTRCPSWKPERSCSGKIESGSKPEHSKKVFLRKSEVG